MRRTSLGLTDYTWIAALLLAAASCGGGGGSAPAASLPPPQIVFMLPPNASGLPPGPDNIDWEIATVNLDASGFRQLTNDGKFQFLPHFSPDGSKIVYTRFAVGGYGDPGAQTDVFVYNLASAKETQLTHTGLGVQGVWSPDGSQIAYGSYHSNGIWIMNADGSNPQQIGAPTGTPDDLIWGDYAWSNDNWILFTVGQNVNNCFKVRTDKMRPDGTSRTQVTDGGPNCTPPGMEQSGDADPGFSPDGQTIFSSRGFPVPPAGGPPGSTERKLYSFSSDAWYPGKREYDLSLPSEPSCIEGVPKVSPDGQHVILFRMCFDTGSPVGGIYLTDTAGSYRTFVRQGFGADWNPILK
jgi:Tol biopolymer transport system component